MSWFDFMFKARGYRFYRNGKEIPRFILFDMLSESEKLLVLNGESHVYTRKPADGWIKGNCYFFWKYDVNGRPVKVKTFVPQD